MKNEFFIILSIAIVASIVMITVLVLSGLDVVNGRIASIVIGLVLAASIVLLQRLLSHRVR